MNSLEFAPNNSFKPNPYRCSVKMYGAATSPTPNQRVTGRLNSGVRAHMMESLRFSESEFGVTFCEPRLESDGWLGSFLVKVEEPGLNASVRVHNSKFIQSPVELFNNLAKNWRGWAGEKTWVALEGELELSATSDSLGHVTIRVKLRPAAEAGSWRIASLVHLEAGQLDFVAGQVAKFFAYEP